MQKGILELVFYVGSTYVTQSNTNPKDILGFGTWERLKGKVCLGLDEDDNDLKTIGKTGGEKTHKLTIPEMPSHKPSVNSWKNPTASTEQATTGYGFTSNNRAFSNIATDGDGSNYTANDFRGFNAVGGDQAHNNMQPYEVVGYMWIRRS